MEDKIKTLAKSFYDRNLVSNMEEAVAMARRVLEAKVPQKEHIMDDSERIAQVESEEKLVDRESDKGKTLKKELKSVEKELKREEKELRKDQETIKDIEKEISKENKEAGELKKDVKYLKDLEDASKE